MFLLAGLPEELIKGERPAFRARREVDVDEPADPMIYFTSLGLGFGAVETVLYIVGTYAEVLPSGGEAVSVPGGIPLHRPAPGPDRDHGPRPVDRDHRLLLLRAAVRLWPAIRTADRILIAAAFHAAYNTAVSTDIFLGVVVLFVTAGVYAVMLRSALALSPHAAVLNPADHLTATTSESLEVAPTREERFGVRADRS